MVDLADAVFEAFERRGQSVSTREIVALIEANHPDGVPGVPRDALEEYVAEITARHVVSSDPDALLEAVDDQVVDADDWEDQEAMYRIDDDRISTYPRRWHDAIGAGADVRDLLEVMLADVTDYDEELSEGGAGEGVPEQEVLMAAKVLLGVDHDEAEVALAELRRRGVVNEDADQHPNARIKLVDDG